MKICLIVANDMVHDSRVDRHAQTLGLHGHDTTVLCVLSHRTAKEERRPHYSIVRRRDLLRELIERRIHTRAAKASYSGLQERGRVSLPRALIRMFFRFALAATFDAMGTCSAKRLDADLYVCNDFYTLRVGAFMKLLKRKVVYDAHELYPDLFGETPQYVRRLLRQVEGVLIRFADLVITVNGLIASEMSSRYGIPLPTVIMNCPKAFVIASRTPKKRNQPKVVLYHGVLTRERGLENVVLACKHLRQGIQVVFRGEGPIKGRLKELSRGLENCIFEKPVPMGDVVSKAAEADVGIVTYLPTTLNNLYASPNKLFEYLQAGLPVVGSNLPFVKQILLENDVGLVFNPHDPKDIARAINHITQDDVYEKLRLNVEKVRCRFSWEVEGQKFLNVLSNLSGQGYPET